MDVRFINPFINATREVLATMAATHPVVGKPCLKQGETAYGDVSGIIGITGDALGSMAISFADSCICRIAGLMLHETIHEVTGDVLDTVGEVTNMISGVARRALEREGLSVYAAIPSVIHGRNHQLNHILKSPSIVIPFSAEQGAFVLDVCIRAAAAGEKRREDFRVTNVRTRVERSAVPAAPETRPVPSPGPSPEARPEKRPPPADDAERIERMKEAISELVKVREGILRELREKPFMPVDQRRAYKKKLPFLDEKIKRLKLDMQALEMLQRLSRDDMDSPKITPHYQHYKQKDGAS
jgi:chemotaxis protein CheX